MYIVSLRIFVTCFGCLAFVAIFNAVAMAQESRTNRVSCGLYSFVLPDGYGVRVVQEDRTDFLKELVLNDPYKSKEAGTATIVCLRERKTDFEEYALGGKQSIKLRVGPKQTVSMVVTATEDLSVSDMRVKYSILEERIKKGREIRGIHYYVPVIEIGNQRDEYHTLIFINDFRKNGNFFDMDGYRSSVNRTVHKVLQSIQNAS